MAKDENKEKLKELLSELFQLDMAELCFNRLNITSLKLFNFY